MPFKKGDSKAGRLLRSGLGNETSVSWVEGGTLHFITAEIPGPGTIHKSLSMPLQVHKSNPEMCFAIMIMVTEHFKGEEERDDRLGVYGTVLASENGKAELHLLRWTLRVHGPAEMQDFRDTMRPEMCVGLHCLVSLEDGTVFFGTVMEYSNYKLVVENAGHRRTFDDMWFKPGIKFDREWSSDSGVKGVRFIVGGRQKSRSRMKDALSKVHMSLSLSRVVFETLSCPPPPPSPHCVCASPACVCKTKDCCGGPCPYILDQQRHSSGNWFTRTNGNNGRYPEDS